MLAIATAGLLAADKDTQAASATRKKLQVNISVDFKEEYFGEILKEIKKQIEDAGASSLSWTKEAGVSENTKYSYSAKNQTVAEVLDGMLKKNNLGYIVVSKQADRYDGWLKFKQGTERGYPAGEEPKSKSTPKSDAKTLDKSKEKSADKSTSDDEKTEKAAATKLDLARELLKDGKKDKAKQRFQEIIDQYPKTKAAGEA